MSLVDENAPPEEQIARQAKIIDALMRRANRSNDVGVSAYSAFQSAIELQAQVAERLLKRLREIQLEGAARPLFHRVELSPQDPAVVLAQIGLVQLEDARDWVRVGGRRVRVDELYRPAPFGGGHTSSSAPTGSTNPMSDAICPSGVVCTPVTMPMTLPSSSTTGPPLFPG